MKKTIRTKKSFVLSLIFSLVLGLGIISLSSRVIPQVKFAQNAIAATATATQTVHITTNVTENLVFTITAGGTVALGALLPGTPVKSSAGTVASVTSNAANGYTLALSDGSGTNSCLRHTDATTYITDYAGTLATPTTWTSTGLGITMFAADTTKEVKWGTGTTYGDALNKYASVPSAATVAHTAAGFHATADTSSWAFELDVPGTQKTGSYAGDVTMTVTCVLS